MSRTAFRCIAAWLSFLFVVGEFRTRVNADEWTNLRGTSTVFAKLIGVWNDRALLKLEDGRQVSVKLDDLNAASRIRAQDQQAEINSMLQNRVGELDAVATAAAASMPATIPALPSAPQYIPPRDGDGLQTALDHIQSQAQAGHFRVYYDSLPKSYQAKADELFQLALKKVNPDNWEQCRSTMHRLTELMVTRQRWLFSHPKFESISDTQTWLSIASAFRQWGNEETASLAALQKNTLGDALAKLDDVTAPYLYKMIESNPTVTSLAFPPYQVETGEGGKMIAKVVLPLVGTVQSIPMVQVEGRWIEGATPDEALAKWDGYKKSLELVPDRSLQLSIEAQSLLFSVTDAIAPLEQAKSKTAFHRALDDAITGLVPTLNTWAGINRQPNGYADSGEAMQDAFNASRQAEEAARAAAEAAQRRP